MKDFRGVMKFGRVSFLLHPHRLASQAWKIACSTSSRWAIRAHLICTLNLHVCAFAHSHTKTKNRKGTSSSAEPAIGPNSSPRGAPRVRSKTHAETCTRCTLQDTRCAANDVRMQCQTILFTDLTPGEELTMRVPLYSNHWDTLLKHCAREITRRGNMHCTSVQTQPCVQGGGPLPWRPTPPLT